MAGEDLKTCYTCLDKVGSLTDLLEEDSDNISFMTKLSKFCTIEVIPEAVGICSDCLSQLRVSYEFLNTVTTSQEAWKDCLSESNLKTEEILIINDAEYTSHGIDENSSGIEEAENVSQSSSCYDPLSHDDHLDSDSNPRKENDNYFRCANCSKVFLDEEFLFHGCFKSHNNNNRNLQPKKDSNFKREVLHVPKLELRKHVIDSHELKKVENTEPNLQCRNSEDNNNFVCARCLKVFSYKEFLFHGCFKDTHSKVNKFNSPELNKVKNIQPNHQCGSNFDDDDNFECAKCLKVFSTEEFLFHGCFKSTQRKVDNFNNHNRNTKAKVDSNSKKKVFHCTICRKALASEVKLQKHMTDFHEFKELKNIEPKFDTDSNDLGSDLNIFKCVKCSKVMSGKEFILHSCFESTQQNNNANEKTKVETKPKKEVTYECMACGKLFEGRFGLRLHLSRAHKETPYKCNICEKKFKKSLHLKQHLTLHTGQKYFSCEICQKEFRLLSAKQRHMKVHTTPLGERTKKTPFLCNICGRHFPFSNGYQRHMSIHLGIKRHECKVCNRRFRESTHLKVHMRTHTGEKPYMCDVCGQAFSLKASLQKHINNIHNNESKSPNFNFMCGFCGENFNGNVQLHTHIGRVHSDENI